MKQASEEDILSVRTQIAARYGEDTAQDVLVKCLEKGIEDGWQFWCFRVARFTHLNTTLSEKARQDRQDRWGHAHLTTGGINPEALLVRLNSFRAHEGR